ncbi:hypothetical protein GCM10023143_35470 [Compostibacter hankyongensis]|uniref:Polysaccharide export protein n=2 Tax=Compostibacter hankyongensis TaxID=1007089 RepID=A0ABP8GB69_9BACT
MSTISKLFLAACVAILCCPACTSTKHIAYFQNINDTARIQSEAISVQPVTPTIQPDDILSITVSSTNQAAAAPFNQGSAGVTTQMYMGETSTVESLYGRTADMRLGYLVDADGSINFPSIGKLPLKGLTLQAAQDTLTHRLLTYLADPIVNIRFLNYKITILGEVARPGTFNIPNQQITLLQALGMAGDMTVFGKRVNVMVVREKNGERTYGRINMNDSKSLFTSPYYYLQQNDVVYVEPRKTKVWNTDNAGLRNVSILATILSALSLVATRF